MHSSTITKVILFLLVVLLAPADSRSQNLADRSDPNKVFVIGFVGGLNHPDDLKQGVVRIGKRLRSLRCSELQVETYSHFHWRSVYQTIFRASDLDRDGSLSEAELRQVPKLVLVGHSLGGWAVVKLAKRLEKAGIPVELTVQIDTVGIGDEIVPGNVKSAMNYYQRTEWPIRGERRIKAADERATKIIANVLVENVRHEALAREARISDFVTDAVRALCPQLDASSAIATNHLAE